MPLALLLAMGTFSLSLSVPPGPMNLAVVASGASRGFRRTLPFATGVTLGFILLLAFVGFQFIHTIEAYPRFSDYLGMTGTAFTTHVGYRIAIAGPHLALEENGVPGFFQDMLLQWLNPKAWIACASDVVLFASSSTHAPLLVFMAIYLVVCYLPLAAWILLGDRVALLLDSPRRVRLFNRAISGTLMLTASYIFYPRFVASSG